SQQAKSSGELVHKLELELRNGLFATARYSVQVIIAEDSLLEAFHADQLANAKAHAVSTQSELGDSALGRALSIGVTLAESPSRSLSKPELLGIYRDVVIASNSVRGSDSAKTKTAQQGLSQTAILLADQISRDLRSSDPEIVAAATAARDQLVA